VLRAEKPEVIEEPEKDERPQESDNTNLGGIDIEKDCKHNCDVQQDINLPLWWELLEGWSIIDPIIYNINIGENEGDDLPWSMK
jgi:hypothetical protein